jgi:hypothetical protein
MRRQGKNEKIKSNENMFFDPNKINLVLDLDNTLISSKEMNHPIVDELKHIRMENYYRVYLRPYLQEFLDFAFKNFNVCIWTAASKSYAFFVNKRIVEEPRKYDSDFIMLDKPTRKIKILLYGRNCEESMSLFSSESPKDLKYLFVQEDKIFTKCNTIIIDDLAEVNEVNKGNSIRIPYFDSENNGASEDDFLLRTMDILNFQKKKFEKTGCIKL